MKTIHIVAMFIISTLYIWAQIPQTVSVQGQLWKANGEPLDDGTYEFTVTLVDAPAGSTPVEVCNPCSATTKRGVFSLTLGGEGQPALPPMDKPYWVAIFLNGEELLPRMRLNSVPYALNSMGAVPIGTILPFAGSAGKVPQGWLVCDGSAQKSASFPRLLETTGRIWGDGSNDGDPETDFNLPDLRGMFLRGADAGSDADKRTFERQPANTTDLDDDGVATYQGAVDGFNAGGFNQQTPNFTVGADPPVVTDVRKIEDYVQGFTPNAAVLYIIRAR